MPQFDLTQVPGAIPDQPEVGAGEFGKVLGAETAQLGSNVAAGARYFYELGGSKDGADIAQGLQKIFGAGADAVRDTYDPETRKLMSAAITSEEFWDRPVLASALKTTGMVPSIAALAIPGGLLADTVAASMAVAGGGGALAAGQGLDEFYKKLDEMPDADLQAQSSKYAALRSVMDERDARAKFNREAQGWAPAINAILGAGASVVGPAGTAARRIAGGTGNVIGAADRGALAAGGLGAVEGAVTNAAQSGVADVLAQQADVEANFAKDLDYARAANAALEGGAFGGVLGGVAGGVLHRSGKAPSPEKAAAGNKELDKADAVQPVSSNDVSPPQPESSTQRASQEPAKPVESVQVGNPQSAPTGSDRVYPKGRKGKAAKGADAGTVERVEPAAPDVAQQAAIAAQEPAAQNPDVNAALQRLTAEVAPVQPPEATPEVTPRPVPPEVQQAVQRTLPSDQMSQPVREAPVQAHTVDGPAEASAPPVSNMVVEPRAVPGSVVEAPAAAPAGPPRTGRVLRRVGDVDQVQKLGDVAENLGVKNVKIDENLEPVVDAEGVPVPLKPEQQGKKRSKAEVEALDQQKKGSADIVARHAPTDAEADYSRKIPARDAVVARAQKMVDEARAAGIEIKKVLRRSIKGDAAGQDPNVQVLTLANELVQVKQKHPQGAKLTEAVGRFKIAETEARAGFSEDMLANRRAEGDEKMAARKSGTHEGVADDAAPKLEYKEEAPQAEVAGEAPVEKAPTVKEAEDTITTASTGSKRPIHLDDGTEEVNGRTRAKAATGDKLAADAERKAKLIAEMNAKLRAPTKGDVREDRARNLASEQNAMRAERERTVADAYEKQPEIRHRVDNNNFVEVWETPYFKLSRPTTWDHEPSLADKTDWTLTQRHEPWGKRGVYQYMRPELARDLLATWKGEKSAGVGAPSRLEPEGRAETAKERAKRIAGKYALRVERNPTEAQKAAGNYKKGHRNVEGLDFTIENPKGAVRRGRGPEGDWSVRMPDDYGYIRRTTGADGDHIDAYDGRSGGRYFIVDQLDHRTGEFDEHKVMLRYKDEDAARAAYERAFSDGMAKERMGHIHEVSLPELKAWLKQGDHQKSHLEHVVRDMDRVNFDVPDGRGVAVIGGDRVRPVRSAKASHELANIDYGSIPGVGGVLGKFFQNRLSKLAGDTDVHYISQAEMNRISEGPPGALGLHVRDPVTGESQLFVSTDAKEGFVHGGRAHVLLHELAHEVTVREIMSSPKAIRDIGNLMAAANEHLNANLARYDLDPFFKDKLDYGLTNVKEFIAEAFSNPAFQHFLSEIPAPAESIKALGLDRRSMSMWDVFRGYVKKAIEKITGKLPEFDSVLDGIMKVGEHLTKVHEFERLAMRSGDEPIKSRMETRNEASGKVEKDALRLVSDAQTALRRLQEDANTMERAPFALKLRTFDNIAKIADHYFGESNPVRKIYNAIEKMRVTSEGYFNRSEPVIRKLLDLRAKNPEMYREFSSLLHDATVANVHPDVALTDAKNAHLGKKRIVGDAVWSKSQHAGLSQRYSSLDPEFKDAWHAVTKYFRDQQNQMSLGIIENRILKSLGIEDAQLAQRIHDGTFTDADRARVGEDLIDTIAKAGELSKIEGPYVPLMRRGDHVVKGRYDYAKPANAKEVNPNEFEFDKEKDAADYAKQSGLKATIKKVWVDEATGQMHETDPATGVTTKVSAKDLHAVPRYRVAVQNEHVEFVDGNRAAERRKNELAAQGLTMDKVVPRRYEVGGRQASDLSASLQALVKRIENSDAYKQSTPTQQAMLRQAIEQAAMASHGSTRIQSKALPRRGVVGYSEDLVKNTGEYAESSSRYLAKLDHMPEVEAGMKAMEERLKQDESKTNQYGRTAIRNEVTRRVQGDNGFDEGGDKFSPVVKRAMAISFIDKLASPAYSVINAMQPGMVTMPYLAGRHGVARSVTEMGRAYSDLAALSIIKQGAKETVRRIKGDSTPDDFIANAKAGLKSADERAMLDYMVEHGVVDPAGGMEIKNLTKDYTGVGGKIDKGIGYLEGVTREMPRAVEAINRMVTSLAAYRLERGRGATHEQAVRYAQDTVESTQFNYSPTNTAPFMNHPLAKMAFQFKKYGQGMYQLLGGQIGKAFRNASPGDRAEAVKTLIAIAGTHMAMAGALGLPTEPFKYLVMASGLVGGPQWGDVEDKVRKVAADVFGKTGGEVFSRGLPRLLNLDLSRMGLDSVTSFGEPRSAKDADVKSWFFDTLGGPVAGLAFDWGKGFSAISNGDYVKGAEKLIPIKVAADSLRAYRQATEGKKRASGAETSAPYNWQETIQRAAGFGNAREAEEGAASSAYFRQSGRQKEERQALVDAWTSASPSSKTKAMAAITKWNQGKPDEVKIKPAELTKKLAKMEKDAQTSVRGITPSKRDRRLLDELDYYNAQ